MIKAVIFDLDDTLYPEIDYVKSGFKAVSAYLETNYIINEAYHSLCQLFRQDGKDVFNRFLSEKNLFKNELLLKLLEIYRNHQPEINLYDDSEQCLVTLKKNNYKTGLITDGRERQQNNKIEALDIKRFFDVIIINTDIKNYKPAALSFIETAQKLDVEYKEMLYVGDNPAKDFAVKAFIPLYTARIVRPDIIHKNNTYNNNILPDSILYSLIELKTLLKLL